MKKQKGVFSVEHLPRLKKEANQASLRVTSLYRKVFSLPSPTDQIIKKGCFNQLPRGTARPGTFLGYTTI